MGGTILKVLCRESIKKFYIDKLGFDKKIFCESNYSENLSDIKKSIRELSCINFTKIYAKDGALESCIIVANLNSKRTIRLTSNEEKNGRNIIGRLLVDKCFSDTKLIPINTWELDRHSILLKAFEDVDISPRIPDMKSIIQLYPYFDINKKYVVINMDTSVPYRSWDKEKFYELALYIYNTYHINIVFCGSRTREIKSNGTFTNLTGKTSINEWISVIFFSEFLIGVDSASIHVAASLGVPSIVLCGEYESSKYFPYPDYACNKNTTPICIKSSSDTRKCECCLQRRKVMKNKNFKCYYDCFKNQKTMHCLNGIGIDTVKVSVDRIAKHRIIPEIQNISERRCKYCE